MTLAAMPAPRASPLQRASSPRVNRILYQRRPSQAATHSNRIRQPSTLSELLGQPLELVAENSREEGESPVPPDHISTSASEDSGASNSSQTKILDFIGATCEVTSWFTSCFPCAVVDIDEQDGQVADKLSKESAMNALYSPVKVKANNEPLPEEAPQDDSQCVEKDEPQRIYSDSLQRGAIDTDVVYTHLPIMTVAESELIRAQGKKLSVIADDDATEVETISLDSERQHSPVCVTNNRKKRIVPKKMKKFFKSGKKKNSGRKV